MLLLFVRDIEKNPLGQDVVGALGGLLVELDRLVLAPVDAGRPLNFFAAFFLDLFQPFKRNFR